MSILQLRERIDLKFEIIIPIYKPDGKFNQLLHSIRTQSIKNIPVLIIDSGSDTEKYKKELLGLNIELKKIKAKDFNHGATRQMGMDISSDVDVFVFLTQDAILADEKAIENIINAFNDPSIGCAFGRQLPHAGAGFFASHARSFNYGEKSYVRSKFDKDKYGIKTVFISNSFAAYRREAVYQVGGFPNNTILSEDMYLAAKMVLADWKLAYVANAKVYHSHDYTICQEFKRYFDIGVFQAREPWIQETFGKAEGEGKRYVISEVKNIMKTNPLFLSEMFCRNGMKLLGFKLGMQESKISNELKRKISMTNRYW